MRHLRILDYVDQVARTGSIRKAAEQFNVTSSAVNRRIMDLEEELGATLFERWPRGVRLTAAGEIFVNYLRDQAGDVERMRSQIEDLKGLRRGTVRLACSQAVALDLLPGQIALHRKRHPKVTFQVKVVDHEQALAALAAYEIDLALLFRPAHAASFQPLMVLEQRLLALMASEHPLAGRRTVRLRDCAAYPIALPERGMGSRQLLDEIAARTGLTFNMAAECNSFEMLRGLALHAGMISFQIRIGTVPRRSKPGLVAREIDDRDTPSGHLVLGQLRGRNLPLATSVFAEQLVRTMEEMRSRTG